MKFSLSWLKKPLDTTASLEEICEKLTAIGLEVEGVEDKAKTFAPFKVAYVESAARHPDADKLQVLQVKTADHGTLQVVCGAPNARAGMKGVFAPEGTYIPGLDVTLKKTAIRGVESNGMMVSEKEMLLSEDHKGIIEVDEKYEIGTPMAQIFGLDDPVIEINLTPNRADCAGVYGIARDLAAAGLGTLKPVDTTAVKGTFKSPIDVKIEDGEGCPLFMGRVIKGVKNGPSPKWLQDLLKSVGLRPISALVDITNFMTMDHARPLHVYDADKIKGNINVRATKGDEKLDALNDKSYEVIPDAVGIYDDSGLIGLGGIVGGTSTGSEAETVNVFLECAYFDPMRIAKAGRALSIVSDARYRNERGIDPEFTVSGIEVATRMILEICGGEASEVIMAGAVPKWQRVIDYDPAYTKQLIGIDVEAAKQKEILEALGFGVEGFKKDGGPFKVSPPSWRGDIEGKADLAEEIMRMTGLEHIPAISVCSATTVPHAAETTMLSRLRKARAALSGRGLSECITWSFLPEKHARSFGANDAQVSALTLKNPISSEMDVMRPSALPNLIEAAVKNADRGFSNAALCECGPAYKGVKPEDQAMVACGIRSGSFADRHWSDGNAARAVDVFDAKADALAALTAVGAPAENAQVSNDAPAYYHPGRSGALRLGPNVLAYFGELHPAVLEDLDADFPVVGFEVFLDNIPTPKKKAGTEKPLLKLEALQPLHRDFAFLVEDKVQAGDIVRAAIGADKTLISSAEIFDVYKGKGVQDGHKSVALTVTIQPKGQTMTDKEIEAIMTKIIDAVCNKTGGSLRS